MGFSGGISGRYLSGKNKIAVLAAACFFAALPGANAAVENDDILRSNMNIAKVQPSASIIRIAQSTDAGFRVNQLEDQIRRLNGQIEELNFQLLQMQEQIRKMQEDNEFRFQELEEKRRGKLGQSDANYAGRQTETEPRPGKPQPSESTDANSNSDGSAQIVKTAGKPRLKPRMIDGVEIFDGTSAQNSSDGREISLGTITFDSLGNVVDTALGKPLDLTARLRAADTTVQNYSDAQAESKFASIGSAKELYELGFGYFQVGDYSNSQQVFSEFVERFPDDKKIPNAQFWLGESMFSQANFKGAAKVFLDAHTNWPDARIAPQTLLKLGISLAGMQQRELACATYVKVFKKYPNMSNALRKRVKAEQKSARCING